MIRITGKEGKGSDMGVFEGNVKSRFEEGGLYLIMYNILASQNCHMPCDIIRA